MKSTSRLQVNNTHKALGKQGETTKPHSRNGKTIKEPGMDDGLYSGSEPICLLMFDHKSDKNLAGCDITAAQMRALREQAALGRVSVGHLLAKGIQNIVSDYSGRVKKSVEAVREATAQSNVLLELIVSHLDYREHRGGEDFTGQRADDFNFGFDLLTVHVRETLKTASEAAIDAAYEK